MNADGTPSSVLGMNEEQSALFQQTVMELCEMCEMVGLKPNVLVLTQDVRTGAMRVFATGDSDVVKEVEATVLALQQAQDERETAERGRIALS